MGIGYGRLRRGRRGWPQVAMLRNCYIFWLSMYVSVVRMLSMHVVFVSGVEMLPIT